MKIRWKVMILLLVIALAPLVVAQVIHQSSAYRLGRNLAARQRRALIADARSDLQFLVEDYGRIVNRDQRMLEMVLGVQACEIERRLAGTAPGVPPRKTYFSADFDIAGNPPPGMVASTDHHLTRPGGMAAPARVSYAEQVYFLPKGVDRRAVAGDMARLADMPEVFEHLRLTSPNLVHWQYVSLASGVHVAFPGHGGYPGDYDPRRRSWYRAAVEAGGITWSSPVIDVISRRAVLTLSMPVRYPDGSVAGVTGIDVTIAAILGELKLPPAWERAAVTMLVQPADPPGGPACGLLVVARSDYRQAGRDWRARGQPEFVACDDPAGLDELTADALAGRSGVRRMSYRGADALWAYGGSLSPGQAFPLVILPYRAAVAPATAAQQYVLDRTVSGLRIASLLLLAVAAGVAVVALLTSRRLTDPILQLAGAARRLSAGDFGARVDIRTRDELAELGRIVNAIGPKLAERERMRQSLTLAMEVQQHLLPEEPPQIPGFEIAGRCVYCDETGGDYYDFIELVDPGAGKLGIAVGDVAGHGIAAALLMASARGALRSQAARETRNPSALLDTLNRHLVRDARDGRFLTLFYGLLDGATRTLVWASAGHDPALWLRHASGRFEELPNTGIPLGVRDDARFGQAGPVLLANGDVVVIGTDGIWETLGPPAEPFGKERLRDVIAQNAHRTAAEIHDAVIDAVNAFRRSTPPRDDMAVVVLKVRS